MGENDVCRVDFIHEPPFALFETEGFHGGEEAEFVESTPAEKRLPRKGAQYLVDALENLRFFVGEEKWLARVEFGFVKYTI